MPRLYNALFTSHRDNAAELERIERAEQRIFSLSNRSRRLQERNSCLNDTIKEQLGVIRKAKNNILLLKENIRRQQEQIHEARQEAIASKNEKDELLSSLTQQIHALQFRHNALDDQEAAHISNQLFSRLERFVRTNFRDAAQLNLMSLESLEQRGLGLLNGPDFLETVHQRRALIQDLLADYIYKEIFSFFILGVGRDNDEAARMVEERIQMLCSPRLAEHWRLTTSIAFDDLTKNNREWIYQCVIERVELYFSEYSSTAADMRAEQLRELITQCMEFKHRLERQEFRYYFVCSQPAIPYDSENMRSITGEQGDDAVVLFSLWPSLWRDTASGERQLIAPEQVWVKRDKKEYSES